MNYVDNDWYMLWFQHIYYNYYINSEQANKQAITFKKCSIVNLSWRWAKMLFLFFFVKGFDSCTLWLIKMAKLIFNNLFKVKQL